MAADVSDPWECKLDASKMTPSTMDGYTNITDTTTNSIKYNSYCNFDDDNDSDGDFI